MHQVILSLAANCDAEKNLPEARLCLEQILTFIHYTDAIWTEPIGCKRKDPYLNQMVKAHTELTFEQLNEQLKAIERQMGRTAKSANAQYADRIIDIDILLYDTLQLTSPELTIPHPLMAQRDFVLRPLAEIAPRKRHPVLRKTIAQLLTHNT